MNEKELPIPHHFDKEKIDKVWKVDYLNRANDARQWAKQLDIKPSSEDKFRIGLLIVDMQNTFCNPNFELFVSGRNGRGALDDVSRLCSFIYKNLSAITEIIPTMDTHLPIQIFHPIFLIDNHGEHPAPYTLISVEDIENGKWKINPDVYSIPGIDQKYSSGYLLHYTKQLKKSGKYNLTIWPYHAMLGGIGHALVSSLEEAIFFHSIVRYAQPGNQIKGNNPFTEHYSVFGPEITKDIDGKNIAAKNIALIDKLMNFDAIIIAGEAKSHCVAWTIEDLLSDFSLRGKKLIQKIYILEDCMSPVVVPNVIDYTGQADETFKKFSDAGIHIVKSTVPVNQWLGIIGKESKRLQN